MKTTIITTLLAVGMLLRPQPTPNTNNSVIPDNPMAIGVTQQATPQVLKTVEMSSAVGGNDSGCFGYVALDGDRYGTCCLDLWIFAICVSVNFSAIERAVAAL